MHEDCEELEMTKETRHFFILRSVENVRHCFDVIKSIYQGGLYSVTVTKYRKNRTLAQNRLYHMWLNAMQDDTGHTHDELHDKLRLQFLGTVRRKVISFYDPTKGGFVEETELIELVSTTSLDTKQFTEYLEKIELVAVELGIILPYPDDIKYAMEGL